MNRKEAQDAYRAAWMEYRETLSSQRRKELSIEMDRAQTSCGDGPWDPEWMAFKLSLPGFAEFWDSLPQLWAAQIEDQILHGKVEDLE